jgi:hypothetical protein
MHSFARQVTFPLKWIIWRSSPCLSRPCSAGMSQLDNWQRSHLIIPHRSLPCKSTARRILWRYTWRDKILGLIFVSVSSCCSCCVQRSFLAACLIRYSQPAQWFCHRLSEKSASVGSDFSLITIAPLGFFANVYYSSHHHICVLQGHERTSPPPQQPPIQQYKVCSKSSRTLIIKHIFHLRVNYTYHPQSTPPTTNTPLPTFLPILEAVPERLFQYRLQVPRGVFFYPLHGVKSSSFQGGFQLGNRKKSAGARSSE